MLHQHFNCCNPFALCALFPFEATFLFGETGSAGMPPRPETRPQEESTMSSNRVSCRAFTVPVLLAAFVLAGVPAQGQPVRRPVTGLQAVAAAGENGLARLWSFVTDLMKEGTSIDPNGGSHGAGTTTVPAGGGSDEGTSIDPDGRQ
jgi:hypothetical protein